MTIQIYGDAPGLMATPTNGTDVTLYRFELNADELVRVRPGKAPACPDADRFFIDVLLNADEAGRYLNGVRGFVVPRSQQGFPDPVQDLRPLRTFKVGNDIMLAIGKSLDVGPRSRFAPKLATLDGRSIE